MADVHRLPRPVAEVWDWQLRASCRDAETDMFFHPEHERGDVKQRREERAKAACRTCPVLERCRQHALAVHEPYGIWGGMTARERSAELAARRKQTSTAQTSAA
ncbi:MAG TPA: WhiB family transcriptional regulator [Pseudonocardiaceae bacterium]|jgi:WhiB family redox-sensing transcriptional regulator|nr:WhiB family transcriptional regulator [Pseudonocardiaceae bacterium]